MIAILIIIAVVAGVSFYDYFSTRSWQQVTSAVRNETVFENRNKKYGAYHIRRDYNRNFILILLGMIGGVGVIYAATTLSPKVVAKKEIVPPKADDTTPVELPKKDDKTPEIPQIDLPKDQVVQVEATYKFTEPKVIDDPKDVKGPEIDPNKNSGLVTTPGTPGFPVIPGNPPGLPPTTITDPPIDPDAIVMVVDEFPEFPGGKPALAKFLGDNLEYPQTAIENNAQGKCYIRFVVSRTGELSDIKVQKKVPECEECDQEAKRVVEKMPRWKPGKKAGKPVSTPFSLPIVFKLN